MMRFCVAAGFIGFFATGPESPETGRVASSQGSGEIMRPDADNGCIWGSTRDREAWRALEREISGVELTEQPLEEVIAFVRLRTGLSVVVNWTALETVGIERDFPITLSLRTVSGRALIRFVLEAAGGEETSLSYCVTDGAVAISTKEDLSRKTVLVIHDCEDFLRGQEAELEAHVLRVVATLKGRGVNVADPVTMEKLVREAVRGYRKDVLKELATMIQNTVDPESWSSAGGNVGSVEIVGMRLVVKQTPMAQEQVCDVLTMLRAKRQMAVIPGR